MGMGANLKAWFKFTWQSWSSLQAAFEKGLFTLALSFWMHFSPCAAAKLPHTEGLCTIIKRFIFFSLTLSGFLHFTPSFYWTVQAEDICISKLHRTSLIFKTIAVLKDSIKSLTFLMSEGTEIKSPYIELNSSNSAFKILSFHNFTHKGAQWKWFSLL